MLFIKVLLLVVSYCLLCFLSHFKCFEVFIFFKVTDNSLISSPFSLFILPFSALLIFPLSAILIYKFLNLILTERSSSLSEKFNNCRPFYLFLLQLTFHSVEHFLESLSWNSRTAFRISGNSGVYCSDLGIFPNCEEKGKHINSIFSSASSWHAIKDVLNELKLLL